MAFFINESKFNQSTDEEEVYVDSFKTVLVMLVDLLKKKPLQLLLGMMTFSRGVGVIWFTVGEVYLTNDVSSISLK